MMDDTSLTKSARARLLGCARSTLYYAKKRPERDWQLKCQIEQVLRSHPSYESPRIALAVSRNHKAVERVMKSFGIKAYRRRGRRWKKPRKQAVEYPNLLMSITPLFPHHAWVAVFTRDIVGISVMTTHEVSPFFRHQTLI